MFEFLSCNLSTGPCLRLVVIGEVVVIVEQVVVHCTGDFGPNEDGYQGLQDVLKAHGGRLPLIVSQESQTHLP